MAPRLTLPPAASTRLIRTTAARRAETWRTSRRASRSAGALGTRSTAAAPPSARTATGDDCCCARRDYSSPTVIIPGSGWHCARFDGRGPQLPQPGSQAARQPARGVLLPQFFFFFSLMTAACAVRRCAGQRFGFVIKKASRCGVAPRMDARVLYHPSPPFRKKSNSFVVIEG